MVPTLYGRMQTRIVLLALVGGMWTLAITPLLPTGAETAAAYRAAFLVLAYVMILGIAWELLYHMFQQFRWEKDWPTFFGLITAIPEGALLWRLQAAGMTPGVKDVPLSAYLWQFITTWLVVWLIANGPIKVLSVHWRFRGGRFW